MTKTFTVYTKPSCVQCTATYRKLDNLGIPFEPKDVSVSDEDLAYIKGLGYLQAPVVTVFDETGALVDHWSGYRPDRISAHL